MSPDHQVAFHLVGCVACQLVALVACAAAGRAPAKALKRQRENGRYLPEILLLAVLFLLSVAALVSQSYNPFIYFRF